MGLTEVIANGGNEAVTANVDFPVGYKKAAAICILRSSAGLLLMQRTKEPMVGMFIPVGGKLDAFEAPDEAATREIREECGLVVDNVELRGMLVETSPTEFNWVNFIYLVDVPFSEPGECNEGVLQWVAIEDLDKIPTPETDLRIYRAVLGGGFFLFDVVYDADLTVVRMVERVGRAEGNGRAH